MPRQTKRPKPWIGPWLRDERAKSDKSPADVARALRRSPSSVSRIETGIARISADDLPAVLDAYGLTFEQLAMRAREIAA